MRRRRVLPSAFLAAATAALVLSFTAFQASGPTAGPRLLGRLAAAMIELDRWLPAHTDDIQSAVRDRPRAVLEVPGLPLRASVAASTVLEGDGARLDSALMGSMGAALYERGDAAFEGGGGLSITDPARWTIAALDHAARGSFEILLLVAGVVEAFLILLVVTTTSGSLVRRALLPIAFGGAAAFAVSLGLWSLGRLLAGLVRGAADREVMLILRDWGWIGVRDGFAAAAGALAVQVLARLAAPVAGEEGPWPGATDEPA